MSDRIRRELAGRVVLSIEGESIPVSASFGVAGYHAPASLETLFEAADAALYEAKRAGKNRVEVARQPIRRR